MTSDERQVDEWMRPVHTQEEEKSSTAGFVLLQRKTQWSIDLAYTQEEEKSPTVGYVLL